MGEGRTIVTLKLPENDWRFRPVPFPGSQEAIEAGCCCPETQPWPGGLAIDGDCPVHPIMHAVDHA